jgi:hypothetical protein
MAPDLQALLERARDRLRDEHVAHLLEIGNDALRQVDVARPGTAHAAFEGLPSAFAEALSRHLASLSSELLSIIENTGVTITDEGKRSILEIAGHSLDKQLYAKRLAIFQEGLGRQFGRAGRSFDVGAVRTDLIAARIAVDSENRILRCKAALADKLEVIAQGQAAASAVTDKAEGKLEQANRLVKLEPNFFGIGLNLNYLIRRLFGRKE